MSCLDYEFLDAPLLSTETAVPNQETMFVNI